ncbi:NAD(P)/FAD-dependent oxidoreductase [Nocardia sp. CDC159]|uniref:NAD(P)/FAD-dependent oxidoreductase n=1 Tax=Nocardia pulmonis TaxID=2951408 RepID=A0A9X2IVK0_9NOCA|nr:MULTISPECIES: NAD(P)/FAD-dependent oxidoreductase [Nocardia]MCM6771880.1 NAD(P)/FAD-dependent oxidoreductase [Nocardia pulmonis]MCM6785462.1 NAD(P)/FAD-dependent oxidoreductase [Nocardia sp. CDC159]
MTHGSGGTTRWDVVVIGSGMGGLTAAAYLAANGKRTLVLEAGEVLGGCTHVFRRKQFEFEVGVHYLGDCGPDGAIPTMLRGVGLDDRIEFRPMDPDGFDTIVYPEVTVKVPRGWDAYLANLIQAFPADAAGLRKFIGVLRALGEATDRITTPSSNQGIARMIASAGPAALWAMVPLGRLLDACKLGNAARSVLSSQASYLSPPHRAATMVHAVFLHNYIRDGGWFPAGGGQVFAAHLASVVRAHGGDWRTHARVRRILVEQGRVTGVELADGERIDTDVVVSNADIKRTFLDLVGRDKLPWWAVKRVDSYRMSLPLFNVYLALDIDLRGRMPITNYFSYPILEPSEKAFDLAERAGTLSEQQIGELYARTPGFVSVQSVKDPACERIAPAGYTNLEVMSAAPADPRFWGVPTGPYDGGRYRREATYLKRKEEITEVLIERAAAIIPNLRDHIVWQEAGSPVTQERYTLSSGGVAYGIDLSWHQFGPFRPIPRTRIKGLFLAGASNSWGPGVEGAMASGVGAAGWVLGRNLGPEIRRGRVYGDTAALPDIPADWDPLMEVGGPEHQRFAPSSS